MQSLGTEHHVRGESSALGQRHSRSWSEEVRSIVQARANKVVRQLDFGAHLDLVLFGDRLYACARAGCGLGSVRICRVMFKSCCHELFYFVIPAFQHLGPARHGMPIAVVLTMRLLLNWRETFKTLSACIALAVDVPRTLAGGAPTLLGCR